MATYPRRPSYGIFVRFRRSRLSLRRGIVRLEDALAIAEQLRAERFHEGDIFVVKEPDGIVVDPPAPEAAAPSTTVASAAEQSLPAAAPTEEPPAPAEPPEPLVPAARAADGERPVLPQAPASPAPLASVPRPAAGREIAALLRTMEQVGRFKRVMERARAAQARVEQALALAERAHLSHPESPAALTQSRERLAATRAGAARSIASFERAGAVMARRLAVARASVGGAR